MTQIPGATAFASAPAAQLPGFAAAWSSDGLRLGWLGIERTLAGDPSIDMHTTPGPSATERYMIWVLNIT